MADRNTPDGKQSNIDNLDVKFNASAFRFIESAEDNITAAAGGGATNAYALTCQTSRVATVATSGDSVKLPPALAGYEVTVVNHGALPMQVYGNGTDTVNDVAAATGVSQMQLSSVLYFCITAGQWYTEGLASGFLNGLPTVSSQDTITAFAGGGQASGTLLANCINRVTTVATAADSVKLPVAGKGLQIIVANAAAANSMNLFPNTGDQINALAANAAFAVPAGKTVTLYAAGTGFWHGVLSA